MHKTINRKSIYIRCALALCCLAAAQTTPLRAGANLEEKARYETFLERKVEGVMMNLLGPGKAKVAVQAMIDFSAKERVSSEAANDSSQELAFKWQDINKPETGADAQEFLPGYPVMSKLNPSQPGEWGKMLREVVFPQAMIKRLTVSLILNENIPEAEVQKVKEVVNDLLAMDPARGDELIVTRARFAPIWYNSETINMLMKYGIMALIAIVGMTIVGLGFLKMAGAVNNMAGASQPQKIDMEMGGIGALENGEDAPQAPELEHKPSADGSPANQIEAAPSDGVIFNVKEDKLALLVKMLGRDTPTDISLIAVHLPQGLRSRFIGLLPEETAGEVMANMAKVRFVDPEMIVRIKEELERRLNGAVGGYEKVLEIIDGSDSKSKERLLKNLEKHHPDVASQVRHHVLLLEDLYLLDDKDFAILAGAVTVEKWAVVIRRMPDSAKEKLKVQLSARAWQILEQTMKYETPPEGKIDEAVEELLSAAWKLIREGRIKKPLTPSADIKLENNAGANKPAAPSAAAIGHEEEKKA
ncbi:MAG: FliG C-terminal domain-containing protein [Elusimicrobiota bacterium]